MPPFVCKVRLCHHSHSLFHSLVIHSSFVFAPQSCLVKLIHCLVFSQLNVWYFDNPAQPCFLFLENKPLLIFEVRIWVLPSCTTRTDNIHCIKQTEEYNLSLFHDIVTKGVLSHLMGKRVCIWRSEWFDNGAIRTRLSARAQIYKTMWCYGVNVPGLHEIITQKQECANAFFFPDL